MKKTKIVALFSDKLSKTATDVFICKDKNTGKTLVATGVIKKVGENEHQLRRDTMRAIGGTDTKILSADAVHIKTLHCDIDNPLKGAVMESRSI